VEDRIFQNVSKGSERGGCEDYGFDEDL